MALQHAHLIDLIAQDPASNEIVLGMTEPRPWDGSDRRIYELQEKVNAYLSFALDGEMAENFPQFATKTVRLQLDCVEEPDAKTQHFIGIVREQIGFQGIEFSVRVVPDLAAEAEGASCGSGCGCHGEAPGHSHAEPAGETGCCGGGGGCGCS